MKNYKLQILGTRGIPGNHGGFETFAERLALYLTNQGWDVVVYCQSIGTPASEKTWKGITLIEIPVPKDNAFWSIIFDLKATFHSLREEGIILVLGYNTAVFSLFYYLFKRVVVTNMDGMEWWRRKWNVFQKTWLFLNERCAIWFSTHLIADHPQIKMHFLDNGVPGYKISDIPYCSEAVRHAQVDYLSQYELTRNQYALVIARPEPENSILEIVTAFSQNSRGYKLVVLGKYLPDENPYHQEVLEAASDEVVFIGAIYDASIVQALRYYARLYIHGHTVGGTNPSLVEAMAADMPILAHYNRFNYWVAGSDAQYFYDQEDCYQQLEKILDSNNEISEMKKASSKRFRKLFSDNQDVKAYEELLCSYVNVQEDVVAKEHSQGRTVELQRR